MRMVFNHGFFGQLALRLQIKKANDWLPTAATDGRHLFYNTEFFKELSLEQVLFIVGHEIGHVMFEHFMRRGDRDPKIWNMAGDYVINLMLKEEGIGTIGDLQPLLDSKYKGMTAEQVYDDLIESGAKPQETLDYHIDCSGNSGDGDANGNPSGVTMTDEERKALSDEIRDSVMKAAAAAGSGNVPGAIKKMIGDITEPKMDWREILQQAIQSSVRSNFTWTRPSRKSQHISAILPGMDPEMQIDICIAIDTSGSISTSMLQDFVGEVAGIMEQFSEYRLRIWQFDTKVYGYHEFTSDDAEDIHDYEIQGGGGTEFDANWKYMKKKGIEPSQLIMFTDGYPWNSWGDPDYCDTVFVIHGNDSIVAPFGMTTYYDHELA